MYLRLTVLVALFSRPLLARLAPPFLTLALVAVVAGWLWTRRRDGAGEVPAPPQPRRNPLELGAALLFALVFVVVLIVTHATFEPALEPLESHCDRS